MILQSSSANCFSQFVLNSVVCSCKQNVNHDFSSAPITRSSRSTTRFVSGFSVHHLQRKNKFRACAIPNDRVICHLDVEFAEATKRGAKSIVVTRISNELDAEESSEKLPSIKIDSNFTNFQQDRIVNRLSSQLGTIHPIPSPPVNRSVAGLFVVFFFVGVVVDKLWTSRRKIGSGEGGRGGGAGSWPQLPTSFSLVLEKDLQRKESVEWVNMVLVKLWKVYRAGIENWLIDSLQPVMDDLKKPDYVQRVEIKQFSLGDEPLSVRNVERRTSRRVNDLQYQIGIRYTGSARMLLMIYLKFGIVPVIMPVGVRDFDIDGELWVKLRLIPTEPWVGAASWAFVSLPRIKFELSPFRLFNLMAIPFLSKFLTKLLTEDLPQLFVRPKKIVLDFQNVQAVGPIANDFQSEEMQEGNKDFVGELSITLVDARELSYLFYGKTDPYVILSLGDQVIHSKKNSQTTVIGPPGKPIWNQDFHLLVANPKREKLSVQVKDSLGIIDLSIGIGEVDLGVLEDTVPTDKIVVLRGGWGLFRNGSSGEILLRMTYKAYVEDEEDDRTELKSNDELSDSDATYEQDERVSLGETDRESFMDVLAALIVSEEFQRIVSAEPDNSKLFDDDSTTVSKKSQVVNPESTQLDSDEGSEGYGGSVMLWLAIMTSILVLITINMGGSSLFNP